MSDDEVPTLDDWVWVQGMLFQALVGGISPNFRRIILRFSPGRWMVQFYLAEESEEDLEEISDAISYFESYLLDITNRLSPAAASPLDFSVLATSEDLPLEDDIQSRILFQRREPLQSD